jgi:hypothetical protein
MDLLKDCANTDLGILAESRAILGLAYRTRASIYNQQPVASIPYKSLGQLLPVEDDANTSNDVTAVRTTGSSFRTSLDAGTLSTQLPPNGVGPYSNEVDISLANDSQLPDEAGWRVHLGTVDEARFPAIMVGLDHPTIATNAALTAALRGADPGDRIVVTGTPAGRMAPGDVSQLAQGMTETFTAKEHTITFKCTPESPWRVGVYAAAAAGTTSKYSSDGSTLNTGVTATATSWSVATLAGSAVWTTTPAEFPFDWLVAGERVTVTAISGTTSPQTATVVRSVNGVVKAQVAGATIALYQPAVYAF